MDVLTGENIIDLTVLSTVIVNVCYVAVVYREKAINWLNLISSSIYSYTSTVQPVCWYIHSYIFYSR